MRALKQRHAAPTPPYLLAILAIRFPPAGERSKTKVGIKKTSITRRMTEARLTGRKLSTESLSNSYAICIILDHQTTRERSLNSALRPTKIG